MWKIDGDTAERQVGFLRLAVQYEICYVHASIDSYYTELQLEHSWMRGSSMEDRMKECERLARILLESCINDLEKV